MFPFAVTLLWEKSINIKSQNIVTSYYVFLYQVERKIRSLKASLKLENEYKLHLNRDSVRIWIEWQVKLTNVSGYVGIDMIKTHTSFR